MCQSVLGFMFKHRQIERERERERERVGSIIGRLRERTACQSVFSVNG